MDPEMNTENNAASMGHIDAGSVYAHTAETACDWHARYALRTKFPAEGVSHSQLERAYRLYYVGTWNAMIAMDEAAAEAGIKPIRSDFADIRRA